jgi:hypothetical protein
VDEGPDLKFHQDVAVRRARAGLGGGRFACARSAMALVVKLPYFWQYAPFAIKVTG